MGVLWVRLDPFFRQESGRGPCEKDQLALAKHEVDSLRSRSVMASIVIITESDGII